MTKNESVPALDVCPTPTTKQLARDALTAEGSPTQASARAQDQEAREVVGELLFATAEAYEVMQTLRSRLNTLQSRPFDPQAAAAVIHLLATPQWERARTSWQLLRDAQVHDDETNDVAIDADEVTAVRVTDVTAAPPTTLSPSNNLGSNQTAQTASRSIDDFLAPPSGTQRVSDLLLELGGVCGWSGIRRLATSRGRITGIGDQPC